MPTCELCQTDVPDTELKADAEHGWDQLCSLCARLNLPAQPRPARPRVTMLDLYEAMGTVDGDRAREHDHA